MFSRVAKGSFAFAVVVTLMAFAPAKSYAETELGESCWQLSPFIDTVRVVLIQADSETIVFRSLYGRWAAGSFYSIAVNGSMVTDDVESGIDFQFSGANFADPFNFGFQFHAKIGNDTDRNGTWSLRRNDGFTNNGTFTYLPDGCPGGAGPVKTGPTANDPVNAASLSGARSDALEDKQVASAWTSDILGRKNREVSDFAF